MLISLGEQAALVEWGGVGKLLSNTIMTPARMGGFYLMITSQGLIIEPVGTGGWTGVRERFFTEPTRPNELFRLGIDSIRYWPNCQVQVNSAITDQYGIRLDMTVDTLYAAR